MAFADMKNDFVFRRIFSKNEKLLCRLLNDLLERTGEQEIEWVEYLVKQEQPQLEGLKFPIVNVQCQDRHGAKFFVEIQVINVQGFLNRLVYEASFSYAAFLKSGEDYTLLTDVVAISICDFELWPDKQQQEQGLPRVPMLSRWNMTEQASGYRDLLQVQYAFLELPKLPKQRPTKPGADLWAWLFVYAPTLETIPSEIPEGPYREALALANQATFTSTEMDAYHKMIDEIQQVRDLASAKYVEGLAEGFTKGEVSGFTKGEASGFTKGEASGFTKGEASGLCRALFAILAARCISVFPEARARIEACQDDAVLDQWIARATTASSMAEVFDAVDVSR